MKLDVIPHQGKVSILPTGSQQPSLFNVICADISRYSKGEEKLWWIFLKNVYTHPSMLSVIYYRIGNHLWRHSTNFFVSIALFFYQILYPLVRMYGGVELSFRTRIGPGLCILHFGPTVIHPGVIAGSNLTLLHRVTIGESRSGVPCIGNNVSIGIGATMIGGISIGNNVNIGAGAVVTRDIPDNCTAIGIPAQPIPNQSVIQQ